MTIDRLSLNDFMMFTGRKEASARSFDESFINGINVFIGTNATGKSTLLKCIYAACEFSRQTTRKSRAKRFFDYFSSSGGAKVITRRENNGGLDVEVYSGGNKFLCKAWDDDMPGLDKWDKLDIRSVFIPSEELLSHSRILLAIASSSDTLPFDHTQIDILSNARLWETKEVSERNQKILEMIEKAIGGKVVYENDTFYVIKTDGLKVEFSMEAAGYKKLGLFWKLIRNGLLEKGSILLWDEPEASVNPELLPLIADILYILKDDGVQIFLATHNYILSKYLDIKKKSNNEILFISLYKNNIGEIKTARSNSYSALKNNPIEESEEKLYAAIIKKSMGDEDGL